MKRILKKNQIIITALAIMIAVAGYINYKDLVSKHAKDARQTNVSLALGETDAQMGVALNLDDRLSIDQNTASMITLS